MNQNNESHKVTGDVVEKQINQQEEQTTMKEKNKQGSTNEIQPFATEDGITQ